MDNEVQVASREELGLEAGSSDVEEVEHELEVLKADTLYHDFCVDVAINMCGPPFAEPNGLLFN